jgi:hypothetical protein
MGIKSAMARGLSSGLEPGLVLLTTQSFSGVGSFSLPANTFTSTYNDYLVTVRFTAASANMNLTARVRASGSDYTGAGYDRGGFSNANNSATLTALAAAGGTSWGLGEINTTYPTYTQLELVFSNIQTSNAFKQMFVRGSYATAAGAGTIFIANCLVSNTTQYDSATIIASTGNFTGSYSVYGYNK